MVLEGKFEAKDRLIAEKGQKRKTDYDFPGQPKHLKQDNVTNKGPMPYKRG